MLLLDTRELQSQSALFPLCKQLRLQLLGAALQPLVAELAQHLACLCCERKHGEEPALTTLRVVLLGAFHILLLQSKCFQRLRETIRTLFCLFILAQGFLLVVVLKKKVVQLGAQRLDFALLHMNKFCALLRLLRDVLQLLLRCLNICLVLHVVLLHLLAVLVVQVGQTRDFLLALRQFCTQLVDHLLLLLQVLL